MFSSTIRFISKGWVKDLYVLPKYYFTYYGFDWVKPFSENSMYLLFGLLLICSIFIALGLFYRLSTSVFFIVFTYIELIDKTNYLNHYYFISLISLLLIFLPANKYFSLDTYFRFTKRQEKIPAWNINIIKFQLGVVYFFAGIAKLNYYWLIEAQPLANWLKHQTDLPLIGNFMQYTETAYLFSWGGALFDLFIPFILLSKKIRIYGYILVVLFHGLTSAMFPIGVFPFVMIISTLIFFSDKFHEKIIRFLKKIFRKNHRKKNLKETKEKFTLNKLSYFFLIAFISFQLLMPFRYLLYKGNLFWTEQGFRFSWRVMLIEKVGYAQFYVHEPKSGRKKLINTNNFLTGQQEKMMATQPDMILQFAHHLRDHYSDTTIIERNGEKIYLNKPKITAEVHVGLFNKGSKLFIDPNVNLSAIKRGYHPKSWILEYEK